MSSKLGTICIVLTAIAFGTMEISLKIAGTAFTPFQLTFSRRWAAVDASGTAGYEEAPYPSESF